MKIAVYCGLSQESWSPKSEKSGIGGSEEAVINMARNLAKWNEVTIYNMCSDEEGTYDGVKYENYEYFDEVETDIMIFWRVPEYVYKLKDKFKAKKTYLWLHDVVPQDDILPVIHFLDGIFVLSTYHANLYPKLRDKLIITSNGIKTEQFNQNYERDPYTIVYGSSYDRGLKELLELWPEIKLFEPRAKLRVFYGKQGLKPYPDFIEHIEYLLGQEGITELGRLSHEEVAREFLSAGVWAYPCWFPEISCITAMKAQAGGAIPVITPTAALDETVKWGLTTREPRSEKGQMPWGTEMSDLLRDSYVKILRKALDPKLQESFRAEMMQDAKKFDWQLVAGTWHLLFGGSNDDFRSN